MKHETTAVAPPPEPLIVRYNGKVQSLRAAAMFVIGGLCLLIPFVSEQESQDAWRFAGVLIVAIVIWGFLTLRRAVDPTPQVIVNAEGVYVREWHAGTVPWANIEYIAHSSSVRRSLISTVTRNRRKPFLLFRFIETPKVQPASRPPLSWWHHFMGELAIQEPTIQQFGLDTPVTVILESIEAHIARWQIENPELAAQETPGF